MQYLISLVVVLSISQVTSLPLQDIILQCEPAEDFQIRWSSDEVWQQIVPDENSIQFVSGELHTPSPVLVGKHWEADVSNVSEGLPYNICQWDLTIEPAQSTAVFALYTCYVRWRCRATVPGTELLVQSDWSEAAMVWVIVAGAVSMPIHW